MKINVNQADFSKALQTSGKSILTRSNLPILSNVLIKAAGGKIELITTNLETATRVVMAGEIENEGDITVNGKTLFEFISQLPQDTVSIEKLGEELVVLAKGFSGRLTTMPPEEFPAIPKIEKGLSMRISCSDFAGAIERVVFSAAQDEGRPILTGVLCDISKEKLKMAATDGYRLSFDEINVDAKQTPNIKFVIPAKALIEVAKIIMEKGSDSEAGEKSEGEKFEITIAEGLSQASFKFDGLRGSEDSAEGREEVEFTSRLIEGEFPSWQKIIPGSFNTRAKIAKDEFVKLVRVASIFARDAGNIVKLKLEVAEDTSGKGGKAGKVSVSAVSAQTGSSDAAYDIEISGPGGEIAFNFRYLLEVLAVIPGDEVFFEINESLNPGKITTTDAKNPFFHIIMPVRLQA